MANVNLESPHETRRECFLEEFKEFPEILDLVGNIATVCRDQILTERSVEHFTYVIDQYQEQPHLLDPHLKLLLDKLLLHIKSNKEDKDIIYLASKYLYILTKTRGHKVVARILPHEVSDLHIILTLLSNEDPTSSEAFECKYILLLWLSIVCLVPFDLSRFDDASDASSLSTCDKVFYYGQKYLACNNRCQEISALMMARFLSRPDVRHLKLKMFINWTFDNISDNCTGIQAVSVTTGILLSYSSLFKHGRREDVVAYADEIFEKIECLQSSGNSKIRKLYAKVVQRIGLVFLKPRLASWRYKRGFRSLSENMKTLDGSSDGAGDCFKGRYGNVIDEEDDADVPEIIERVIEKLLVGLKDKETNIRWSSAKGIGRLTGRLPREMADEVVVTVMELFTPSESEDAWHGGCLCIGELGHRGLLLPQRLKAVVPVILKSLNYDERRGTCSVGSNVRDAASFICWSFARAYDIVALQPFIEEIVRCLVITSLFDREVRVRRAASAALQEVIGRQGNITHGIDIVTTCDYFAVGNLNNCFLHLSVFAAGFEVFRQPVVDHLISYKISHWDSSIRELAAEALGLLVPKCVDFFVDRGITMLLELCTSEDFPTRHGAVLSCGHVFWALACHAQALDRSLKDVLQDATLEEVVAQLLEKLRNQKCFRGVHGDMMRKAFCFFIYKMCLTQFESKTSSCLDEWMEFLNECLHSPALFVHKPALDAIKNLVEQYYKEDGDKIERLMVECLNKLDDSNMVVRCAYCLLIGCMPSFVLVHKQHLKQALFCVSRHALYRPRVACNSSLCLLEKFPPPPNPTSVEERRDAVKALSELCCTVGLLGVDRNQGMSTEDVHLVYEILFASMADYTVDDRGDVGTCVRESCMNAISDITCFVARVEPKVLTEEVCRKIIQNLVQQASEKIDRTRSTAGEVFSKLLYHEPEIPNIPEINQLRSFFPKDEINSINWSSPSDTFPRFVHLLTSPSYSYHLLIGCVVSAGGLTESLVKHSAVSLISHLKSLTPSDALCIGRMLAKIFWDHPKVDRITLPALKTLEKLLTNGCFASISDDQRGELAVEFLKACSNEVSKSQDVKKLLASIDVFCGLIEMSDSVRSSCLTQLMIFLCYKFPIVRKTCASRLYELLMSCDQLVDESSSDEVSSIFTETDWDLSVEELRPIRNSLCSYFGIPAPVLIKKK